MTKISKKIFISYAHADGDYFEVFKPGLKNHLFTSNKYDFGAWEDSRIHLGSFWDKEIQKTLNESDIAILCVSANFLNSQYIEAKEFGVLISKFPSTLIIPIYFNHCNINAWDELSKKQFFKPNGDKYDKGTKDDFAFCDLVKFRETDSKAIPNSNIELYFKDFVKRVENELEIITETSIINSREKTEDVNRYISIPLIPRPTTNFTGRAKELSQFDEKYSSGNVLCIEGLGGIGKTEFIAKFIETRSCRNVIWFESTADSTFESLIEFAGYKELLKTDNYSELAIFLGFRELLERDERVIILDNFHDLIDNKFNNFLKFLKNSLRTCKFILLSRIRIYIEDVNINHFVLEGLADDSLEFAKKIISQNYLKTVDINEEKLLKLCTDLNGHPFAIQLAIQLLSYEQTDTDILNIIKEYKNEKEKLSNRLLDEVFNHPKSTTEEKELLLSISVYRGHFDSLSIKYSYGDSYREPLKNLIDKLLVEKRSYFYTIHSLAREFAYEKLSKKEEAHERAMQYYLQLKDNVDLTYYEELIYHIEKINKISILASYIENNGETLLNLGYAKLLETKINLLISRGYESPIIYNFLTDLSFILHSNLDDAILYANKALSIDSDNIKAILEAKIGLNEGLFRKRILDNPLKVFKQLLQECEENKFDKGECICLSYVGKILADNGKLIEGERKLKISYEKSLQIKYVGGVQHCLSKLADFYLDNERYNEANTCFKQLFEYFEKLKNIRATYNAQNGLAVILSRTGKPEEALKIFEEALNFYKDIGDKKNETVALFNVGVTMKTIDNESGYLSYINMSLQICEEIKDYVAISDRLNFIADCDFENGNYLSALKNYFGYFLNAKKANLKIDTRSFCVKIKDKVGITEYEKLYFNAYTGFGEQEKEEIDKENLTFKPITLPKKIGRNDIVKIKYKDGKIISAKFKKVEQDINEGNCSIVD